MNTIIRAFLNKTFKSWTVWAGIIGWILTSIPAFLESLGTAVGGLSPGLSAKITILVMLLARLRGIIMPILGKAGAAPNP